MKLNRETIKNLRILEFPEDILPKMKELRKRYLELSLISRTKSANESLQINHLVGLSVHVKPEQMPDRARFQSNLLREGGLFDGVCCPAINFIFVLSERIHWWFCYFDVQFLMTLMITK